MIAACSIATFTCGSVVSCYADRLPFRRERGELLGGLLLVAGLALIGAGLSPVLR